MKGMKISFVVFVFVIVIILTIAIATSDKEEEVVIGILSGYEGFGKDTTEKSELGPRSMSVPSLLSFSNPSTICSMNGDKLICNLKKGKTPRWSNTGADFNYIANKCGSGGRKSPDSNVWTKEANAKVIDCWDESSCGACWAGCDKTKDKAKSYYKENSSVADGNDACKSDKMRLTNFIKKLYASEPNGGVPEKGVREDINDIVCSVGGEMVDFEYNSGAYIDSDKVFPQLCSRKSKDWSKVDINSTEDGIVYKCGRIKENGQWDKKPKFNVISPRWDKGWGTFSRHFSSLGKIDAKNEVKNGPTDTRSTTSVTGVLQSVNSTKTNGEMCVAAMTPVCTGLDNDDTNQSNSRTKACTKFISLLNDNEKFLLLADNETKLGYCSNVETVNTTVCSDYYDDLKAYVNTQESGEKGQKWEKALEQKCIPPRTLDPDNFELNRLFAPGKACTKNYREGPFKWNYRFKDTCSRVRDDEELNDGHICNCFRSEKYYKDKLRKETRDLDPNLQTLILEDGRTAEDVYVDARYQGGRACEGFCKGNLEMNNGLVNSMTACPNSLAIDIQICQQTIDASITDSTIDNVVITPSQNCTQNNGEELRNDCKYTGWETNHKCIKQNDGTYVKVYTRDQDKSNDKDGSFCSEPLLLKGVKCTDDEIIGFFTLQNILIIIVSFLIIVTSLIIAYL